MLASPSTSALVGDRVCKLLGAGPTLQIPCISKATQSALKTIEFAQNVNKNKDDLVAIGKACCCITAHIIEKAHGSTGQSNNSRLRQEAKVLRGEMKFILKCVKLPWWKRIFNRRGDECTIQQCRNHLQEVLELLGLGSDVELRALLAAPLGRAVEEVSSPPLTVPSVSSLATSKGSDPSKHAQHPPPTQYLSPSSFMYNHIQGSVSNTITDGSCNISGNNNNINFSSTP